MLTSIMVPILCIWMPSKENDDAPMDHPRQSIGKTNRATRPDGGKTTIEDVLEVLATPRRRAIFYYLQEHEIASVEDLAQHIAKQTAESSNREVEVHQVERVTLDLVHNTLPKLAESQFIEYDPSSRTVRYSQPPELLEAVLRFLTRFE